MIDKDGANSQFYPFYVLKFHSTGFGVS